ncbi:Protein of unknown function, partial [Gryllus bimaculatus]
IRERNPVIHGDWRVRPAAGQGSAPRRRSSERRASPVRFASPMRRRSSATGEAAADATGQRWLLEPSDSCFASPQPAGSFTELSAGCYQYKASPEQLYLDLDRCNRALRVLLEQNSALKSQAKEAERTIGELHQQLDSAERRMRWTKNKADARIAELSLVIATSHLDVERLQQENDILRNQLVIERQSRKDI